MDLRKQYAFIFACIAFNAAKAQSDKQLMLSGNKLYKKQQYEKAAADYKKAAEKNEKNAEAQYNLGNALYKSKKEDEAQKAFDAAAENGDRSLQGKSTYNKGVVLVKNNKLQESINAFKQSLRQNPADEEARENLQKAINELKKEEQPPPPQDKKDKKNKNQDDKQPPPQKNKSKLTPKRAEQMLNAVRQDEKRLQQNHQKPKGRAGGQPDKDW